MYIDWPSNLKRDAAKVTIADADPSIRPQLGAYDFDCDKYMPNFSAPRVDIPVPKALLKETPKSKSLHLDWLSAQHHILTLHYCFETSNSRLGIVRQWASNSSVNAGERTNFIKKDNLRKVQNELDQEVLRLNAFMSLAMQRIEEIRVRYRPRGFWCYVPIVSEGISLLSNSCSPIRIAEN